MTRRVTVRDVRAMKARGERIGMLTAYDYTSSRLADGAGVPIILVGDSLGMVVLGHDSTVPVTMDQMVHHVQAVSRGARRTLVVGDLPFMSYQVDVGRALDNAARLVQEGGAHAVKLEGGEVVAGTVRRIVDSGIPVMGHVGLTPQSVKRLRRLQGQGQDQGGGRRYPQGRGGPWRGAGAFAVVLELLPDALAAAVTRRLSIPHHRHRRRAPLRWSGPGAP